MQVLNAIEVQSVSGATSASSTTKPGSKLAAGAEGAVFGAVVGAWNGVQIGAVDSGSLLQPIGGVIGLVLGAGLGAAAGAVYGYDQGHDELFTHVNTFADTLTSQGIVQTGSIISL